MVTKAQLTPVLRKAFAEAKLRLPDEIAARLTSSGHVRNHGNECKRARTHQRRIDAEDLRLDRKATLRPQL
jgi:hypothetical protein